MCCLPTGTADARSEQDTLGARGPTDGRADCAGTRHITTQGSHISSKCLCVCVWMGGRRRSAEGEGEGGLPLSVYVRLPPPRRLPPQPSCERRTHRITFLTNAGLSSRHILAASRLAGDSSLGDEIIERTEIRIDSTVCIGSQRSLADS